MARSPLEDLHIPSPCPEPWEGMDGAGPARQCQRCQTPVHDLASYTRAEAEALLARPGRLCVRMCQLPDGTVVTRDLPRAWLALGAAASLALAGCEETKPSPASAPIAPPPGYVPPPPAAPPDAGTMERASQWQRDPGPVLRKTMGTIQVIKGSPPDSGPAEPPPAPDKPR